MTKTWNFYQHGFGVCTSVCTSVTKHSRTLWQFSWSLLTKEWQDSSISFEFFTGEFLNCDILSCDTVQSCKWTPTLWRNLLLLVVTECGCRTFLHGLGIRLQGYVTSHPVRTQIGKILWNSKFNRSLAVQMMEPFLGQHTVNPDIVPVFFTNISGCISRMDVCRLWEYMQILYNMEICSRAVMDAKWGWHCIGAWLALFTSTYMPEAGIL